jgi:hypothetical protein
MFCILLVLLCQINCLLFQRSLFRQGLPVSSTRDGFKLAIHGAGSQLTGERDWLRGGDKVDTGKTILLQAFMREYERQRDHAI